MSVICINRVILTGNLTRDPELRTLPSGNSVCDLRLAVSTKWRNPTGSWNDQTNYFDVSVFGGQGEIVAKYMQKGRPVAIDGRLSSKPTRCSDPSHREEIVVLAENMQFISNVRANMGKPNRFADWAAAPKSAPDAATPQEGG